MIVSLLEDLLVPVGKVSFICSKSSILSVSVMIFLSLKLKIYDPLILLGCILHRLDECIDFRTKLLLNDLTSDFFTRCIDFGTKLLLNCLTAYSIFYFTRVH